MGNLLIVLELGEFFGRRKFGSFVEIWVVILVVVDLDIV